MSDGKGIVNIDLGGIGEAAGKLIEKVAGGIGGAFAPTQLVRMAKAQAEADLIAAKSEIAISDIQRRALGRLVAEEAKKQSNIEDITKEAITFLKDNSRPEKMDDDWVSNFFEKSRVVSDKEMQSLWSQLLASEANSPGSVSKRAVNLLADLDKGDAELFSRLCNLGWRMGGNYIPLLFGESDSIALRNGLNYEALGHLESLGLIRLTSPGEFVLNFIGDKVILPINYFDKTLTLEFNASTPLKVGKILLTKTGGQIARVASTGPIEGVFEYVQEKFSARNILIKPETLESITSRVDPQA